MTPQDALVLNAVDAAKQLGLSTSTLAKMRLYGNGPAYIKLGRRVLCRPEDIQNWISENRFRSTSEYAGLDSTHMGTGRAPAIGS